MSLAERGAHSLRPLPFKAQWHQLVSLHFTSPLRGEVGAQRRVRGSAVREYTLPQPAAEPLTLPSPLRGEGTQEPKHPE